ncbi:unnamed protein product [Trichogramma brassicae]|uniref:protein-L-isoaspartate(D-aspartate) O-methyltransferase n=1 Tax=Trichogramma brassicae TaxID=86971 RepID=A0A6H5IRF4_9HYME|nr:unnamed protein product [Trichogramma brassicae]
MGFHGTTNLELVQYLKVSGVIESNLVFNTMKTIDRREFLIDRSKAYIDAPQQIGHGKTISAPHMHARTLEAFSEQLKNGKRALDIGSGTGYVTACMALALGSKGCVVAIECIPELRDKAKQIISNNYPALLKQDRVKLLYGDGKLGYACMGPYDIIHVGVAAAEIPQNVRRDRHIFSPRSLLKFNTFSAYRPIGSGRPIVDACWDERSRTGLDANRQTARRTNQAGKIARPSALRNDDGRDRAGY